MRQNHLSKARAWEYSLNDSESGAIEQLGFSQLLHWLRVLGVKAVEARPPLTFRPKWCWE